MSQSIIAGSLRQIVLGLGGALLFILAIEAAQLGTGGFGFFGWDGHSFGFHGASISEEDGKLSMVVRDQGCTVKVKSEGEVELNEAEDAIARVAAGGFFHLTEDGCGPDLELDARPGPVVKIEIDGKTVAADAAETRERVHQALLRVWRWSGWQAEERIARLEKRGGLAAVLDETAQIATDHGQRVYLGHLLGREGLDDATVARIWQIASQDLGGDYELSQLVLNARPANLRGAELLRALESIGSDYEMQQALDHIVAHTKPDAEMLAGLLRVAQDISSDYEQSQFLIRVAGSGVLGAQPPGELDRVLRSISSDYEQRQAIEAFLKNPGLDRDFLTRLLEVATAGISSDYELRQLLETMTRHQERGQGWPAAADRAVDSIGARHERDQARAVLAGDPPASDG